MKHSALLTLGSALLASVAAASVAFGLPPLTRPQYTPAPPPHFNSFGPTQSNARPQQTTRCVGGNYDCGVDVVVGTYCEYCEFDSMQFQCATPSTGNCCATMTSNTPLNDCGQVLQSACNSNGKCVAITGAATNGNRCVREFAALVPCP
jgi:hypothetical protein